MVLLWPGLALAHVAEQGFVLLLPTGVYTAAGVAAVALTAFVLIAAPAERMQRLFAARRMRLPTVERLRIFTSLLSLIALVFLIYVGFNGPRDPLSNLMPLVFWTFFWIMLVTLAGVFGDLWRWLNPWTGLYRLIGAPQQPLRLPAALGVWPATALVILFSAFLLADIAPDDPARLAYFVGIYWLFTMFGLVLFGPAWLSQVEVFSALFRLYGALSPFRARPDGGFGAPGWRLLGIAPTVSTGVLALTLLGAGSFDGLNETFWWLARIGVNPLEFPGRSAVVAPTILGLVASIVLLIAAFALTVWLGLWITQSTRDFPVAFSRLALSLLPIAFGYHIAHYFTAFLVNGQYLLAALSDPWADGSDYLGLAPFYVTTGFFNHMDTVRIIWLTQAGAVVIGHVWAVLLAHRMATDLFPSGRKAALATAPLSAFMVAYTFLGLWLLAAPRGA
ncbi:hypothetical protein CFI11_12425 [Thalassococcus sp. S3]|nr:hypothetical protein CFI11_12425 [Thalassococcus sp. S3]